MDCQDVIPEGHAHWWHCEAALADDFFPAGPDDVFHRTRELWGRPQEGSESHRKQPPQSPARLLLRCVRIPVLRTPLACEPRAHQQWSR